MPRRPRLFIEGLTYHVFNRVGRGEAPFKLGGEAERFVGLLQDVKRRDGLAVLAWCIMPNHYHLAVRAASVPLWRSIRSLQHAYTRAFNRRCKVLGPLWQARYKARPLRDTDALLRVIAYIHLNPVSSKIVTDPARYRWCGHGELLRRAARPVIDADLVYSLFGGSRRQALRSYLALVRRERGEPWLGELLERLPWWTADPAEEHDAHGLDALGRSTGPTRRRLSAADFVARLEPLLGAAVRELSSAQRGAAVLDARELVAGLAVERWGVGVKELADALGKSRDGVSQWVQRAARRRSQEPAFARRVDDLDRRLAKSLER